MAVLKRNSVLFSGGVDISNTINIPQQYVQQPEPPAQPVEEEVRQPSQEELIQAAYKKLEQKAAEISARELQLRKAESELEEMKTRCMEQGKEVIMEAKRRAETIVATANDNASQIMADAETNRNSVFIKAKSEGFEQGKKSGEQACLAAGRDVLEEAKRYSDKINAEKDKLFADYEAEIYATVMEIAQKVTLDSITSKDSMAIRRLIKKASKEFRNCQRIKITLKDNGANQELAGDYEYLKELCGGVPSVEVELLPDVEEGTVIVDNGSEIVDAGIQTQLRMIQELGSGKFRMPTGRKKKTTKSEEKQDKPADNED